MAADPRATALFLGAFFDELVRWGVHDVVVSPGSRSTPLAMTAYELSRHFPERLRLFVDVDERGAAFFALGIAKASGRPVAVICTSGTAVANYYPAVMEAESSRVPLVVLTGDRPPRLQGLGAPQTCDQLNAYGSHVRAFRQMPLPSADAPALAFARQAAREACIASGGQVVFRASKSRAAGEGQGVGASGIAQQKYLGPLSSVVGEADSCVCGAETTDGCARDDRWGQGASHTPSAGEVGARENGEHIAEKRAHSNRIAGFCEGGPVHLNFPFDEPLKPDMGVEGLFEGGRRASGVLGDMLDDGPGNATSAVCAVKPLAGSDSMSFPIRMVKPPTALTSAETNRMRNLLQGRRVLVLAGEGSCATQQEAQALVVWAEACGYPLLADPLSGLRTLDTSLVIDNYDTVLGASPEELNSLVPEVVIRFGRYPVSKRAVSLIAASGAYNIVVDALATRDFNSATDVYVACSPCDFVRSMVQVDGVGVQDRAGGANGEEACIDVRQQEFARAWVSANDAARARITAPAAPDSFEGAFVRRVVELAPEGSCLFTANSMSVRALDTFYLRGNKELSVLCNRGLNGIDGTVSSALGAAQEFEQTTLLTGDLTMLHDINAFALQRELRLQRLGGGPAPSIVIVLLNNNGGGIFDMLPQRSADSYFERLFLTPQDVNFGAAAAAFGVPHKQASTLEEFDTAYQGFLGVPGITCVEVSVPLEGLPERYAPYW